MRWLPVAEDFRAELRAAQTPDAPAERLERLYALSQHRLNHLETLQLDRVLSLIAEDSQPAFACLKLALLSSFTVDHLLPGLKVAALRRRYRLRCHVGTYGQYRQDLLDPSSRLYEFAPQFALFALGAGDALNGIALTASAADADGELDRTIEELRGLWRAARERLGASVIQQTFLNTHAPLFGSFERQVAGAPARLVARLNDRLIAAAAQDGIALLDLASAAERDGLEAWFDQTRWFQAKMQISPQAAPHYGELAARVIAAQRGLSKKCLVLDLDNTLWGGVIGDDGLDGIVLGEGSAAGEAHLALQRYAKQLSVRGIALAVCSKNDPAVAEHAFENHPEMILKRSDIACFIANWEPKSANIRRIAATLNLGVDSLVFVDDNPAERAAMRQAEPLVAVPELGADAAEYVRCLADAGYFEAVAFTSDDQNRSAQYVTNAARAATQESAGSLEDFLRGLNMVASYGPVKEIDLTRVTQLINKTNQFNPTTRRCTQEEIARLCADPECIALQFRLSDRFGDNGLVSVMILRPEGSSGILAIDTWVMSCRVFGRELELEAMNIAAETARSRGASALRGEFIPSSKNSVIKDLYSEFGFAQLEPHDIAGGTSRWELILDRYRKRPTHILRRFEP